MGFWDCGGLRALEYLEGWGWYPLEAAHSGQSPCHQIGMAEAWLRALAPAPEGTSPSWVDLQEPNVP